MKGSAKATNEHHTSHQKTREQLQVEKPSNQQHYMSNKLCELVSMSIALCIGCIGNEKSFSYFTIASKMK
jgi:hypothetical protein